MTARPTLRLGSANLFSGRALPDGRGEPGWAEPRWAGPEQLAEAVRLLDVDLLAVQEIERFLPRSALTDQPAVVAAALGAVEGRFAGTIAGTPGEDGAQPSTEVVALTPGPAEGDPAPGYGIGLFSRRPVTSWHVLRLEGSRRRYPLPLPTWPPRVIRVDDEPRAAVAAVLEEPGITVVCTHLSFVPTTAVRQLARVQDWVAEFPAPHVLLGDLNLPPAVVRRVTRATPLVSAPTFPSPRPRLQLDHALATGLPADREVLGQVLHLPISDHRALRVTLSGP